MSATGLPRKPLLKPTDPAAEAMVAFLRAKALLAKLSISHGLNTGVFLPGKEPFYNQTGSTPHPDFRNWKSRAMVPAAVDLADLANFRPGREVLVAADGERVLQGLRTRGVTLRCGCCGYEIIKLVEGWMVVLGHFMVGDTVFGVVICYYCNK